MKVNVFPHYQSALSCLWKMATPGIRLDLKAMRQVAEALGNPWKAYPCILIAGTNGKGSTASMLAEILAISGLKTGLYTSPHLISYRERFCIKTISGNLPFHENTWCRAFAKVKQAVEDCGVSLTQFELLTAMAFLYFLEEKIDVAVLEVGMGGRLDATNVVDPILSIVTIIDFDHQEYLGNTLSAIAREKAGIFRKNVPAFTLLQNEEALNTLKSEAEQKGALLQVVESGTMQSLSLEGQSFVYQGKLYWTSLLGVHQVQNASLVIESARYLQKASFPISEDAIALGLAKAQWPARFEILRKKPVVVLDGAHNPHGALALANLLHASQLPKPHLLILGILEGKDALGILQALSGWADEIIFCRSFSPRAIAPEKLFEMGEALFPKKKFHLAKRVGEACKRAFSILNGNGTLCVAGSLTVAGEARRLLQ
jgi:dihydrofolate synthase/folylpolyglutamate synthase